MSAHDWAEQAAPFALGALDEQERAAFEAHLAMCDICEREVREMREVAGLLALGGHPVEPPAALRHRIMADARTVRPISSGSAPVAATQVKVVPARRFSPLPWVAAAAAIVFSVVLGERYRGERAERVAAEEALAVARARLDSSGVALASRDSLISSLTAPDVQAVSVSGNGPSPSARYYLDRRRGRIVIAVYSLPPAARGRTYQLWGIATGQPPVSLGTFDTDSGGRALATLSVPPGLRMAVTAVTDEPAGGSAQPTTTPFLAATWKSE